MSRWLVRLAVVLLVCGCSAGQHGPQPSAAPADPSAASGTDPQRKAAETAPLEAPPTAADSARAASGPGEPARPERAHGLTFRFAGSAPKPVDMPGIGQLIVADRAELTLDLEDGTRVVAAPDTRLCALAFAPSLLLVAGQLQITRLADAAHAGSVAGRIATQVGALETTPSMEATLRVEAQARPEQKSERAPRLSALRAQLQLRRGSLTWLALDEQAQLRETQLTAGAARPVPAVAGLHWLAASQARPALDAAFRKLPWLKQPSAEEADRALEQALSAQQALRERGHELLASVSPHHAALAKLARDGSTQGVVKPDSASTRDYQRALVEHAQRSHAQAAQLLLAAERSLLQALLGCGSDANSACAPLQAWSARFSARVASLL